MQKNYVDFSHSKRINWGYFIDSMLIYTQKKCPTAISCAHVENGDFPFGDVEKLLWCRGKLGISILIN